MTRCRFCSVLAAAMFVILFATTSAHAQGVTRTWVSGVGDDVNPCSRVAPCKTFAGAISKTAAGGEINVVDAGAYGAVTITKSISIIARNVEAGVLVGGTNAIIINSATAKVRLEGLDFEGSGTGLNGIRILAATEVHVKDCTINGFGAASPSGNGISVEPNVAGQTRVFVYDTVITDGRAGVLVKPAVAGSSAKLFLDNVRIIGHSGTAVESNSATGSAEVVLNRSFISNNATGLASPNAGAIVSLQTNVLFRNATDGSTTSNIGLK